VSANPAARGRQFLEELAEDYGCKRDYVEEAVRCELAIAA